jgi:zinc protease
MKNRIVSVTRVIALGALVTAPVLAQNPPPAGQSQSTKGAVIKGKAPVNKEVLRVKLPKPYETTLKNGLQVVILSNHKVPTFDMQMVILSGGFSDPAGGVGGAQFTASLLREGTKTRSSKQIAEQIDALGGTLNATAGLSSITSVVNTSGLVENFDPVLDLFADVVLNPTFPADEFAKLKTRTQGQLRLQRGQASFLAAEKFRKVMYGNHPAARFSLSPADLDHLTPEVLQKFHSTYYKPNNAILAITGDVRPTDIVPKLEKAFASWQRGEVPQTTIAETADTGSAKIYLIDRPGSVQTNLLLGTLSIKRTDPDFFPLEVLNAVLGGGPTGRLFLNLREDKSYTYGAYSNLTTAKYRGVLQANTEVRTAVTDGSMKEILYEFGRLRNEKVPATELENEKRSIIGSFALQLESPQSLLQNTVTQKLYGLPADYWDTYPQKIAAVTADDVEAVAKKYINLDKLQVVAVGDAKQIETPLKKYGTVEMYNIDGKRIEAPAGDTPKTQ